MGPRDNTEPSLTVGLAPESLPARFPYETHHRDRFQLPASARTSIHRTAASTAQARRVLSDVASLFPVPSDKRTAPHHTTRDDAPSSYPSLLIVVDGVVYVFLCIVERHESVAVRAKAGAVAVAKDKVAATGKRVRCLVSDQIDRVAVEDFVSGRGLHELDSVDSLSLEVVWPANSYRGGATSFQLCLNCLYLTCKQPSGHIPWLDEVDLESRTDGFAGLQQRLTGDERRVVAAVIWRLGFVHDSVVLIAERSEERRVGKECRSR